MKSKPTVDLDKVAKGLGAERRGEVAAGGGYFGAMGLAAEVQARFRTPPGGGRSTDPSWTERRLVALAPKTLERLERLAKTLSKGGVVVAPLQVAALLLEHAVDEADPEALARLERKRAS